MGNSAERTGGALHSEGRGPVTLVSLTVSENAAAFGGGLYFLDGSAPALLRNSIIWGNTAYDGLADDVAGGSLAATSSYNLIGTGGSGGLSDGINHNQVGVVDAGLLPLADNGGNTLTYPLRSNSPARGAGDPSLVGGSEFGFDQRGVARTSPVSIGAYQD